MSELDRGKPGPPGKRGKQGRQGSQGDQGLPGVQGVPGAKGQVINIGGALVALLLILMLGTTVAGVLALKRQSDNTQRIEQGGYENCEDLNTNREVGRVNIQADIDQIRQSHYADYAGFFTRAKFEQLKAQQIKIDLVKQKRLAGEDCEARFPKAQWEPGGVIGSKDERTIKPGDVLGVHVPETLPPSKP